jgi:hypothetical protein
MTPNNMLFPKTKVRFGYIHHSLGHELFFAFRLPKKWIVFSVVSYLRFGKVTPKFKPWATRFLFGPLKLEINRD